MYMYVNIRVYVYVIACMRLLACEGREDVIKDIYIHTCVCMYVYVCEYVHVGVCDLSQR
jgi:hypothetical protein